MALPHRCVGVLNLSLFKVRQQALQKRFALPSFEPNLLLIDPRIPGCCLCVYGFACGAQILAHMEKIEQVVALRTKLVFHLAGDPRRTIAYAVNVGLSVETGAVGTRQQLGASRINRSEE